MIYNAKQKDARKLAAEALEARHLLTLLVDSIPDVVDGNTTTGNMSLREAVELANASPGEDTITFDSNVFNDTTIDLLMGEMVVTESLTVDATDARVTIDAQGTSRALNYTAEAGDLRLVSVSIQNGRVEGARGGAIRFNSDEVLKIIDGHFTNNKDVGDLPSRGVGGAIFSEGSVIVERSTFEENESFGAGGAIASLDSVTISNSQFSSNRTTFSLSSAGGAVYSLGHVDVKNSVISGNSTTGNDSEGGAIFGVTLSVSDSQFHSNTTAGIDSPGGAIFAATRRTYIERSTFHNNGTYGRGSGGGAIAGDFSNFWISESTFQENFVRGNSKGGAVAGSSTILKSTFVGNESASSGGAIHGGGVDFVSSVATNNRAFGDGGAIDSSRLDIVESTISRNSTIGNESNGGGISAWNLKIVRSTITENSAGLYGGGINATSVELFASTVSGNNAGRSGGGIFGGLIAWESTITGNTSGFRGGGVEGSVSAINSILAGNDSPRAPDLFVGYPVTPFTWHSLIGDQSSTQLTPSDTPDIRGNLIGSSENPIDPRLGPLSANGGPTLTHPLLSDSPAIDLGSTEQIVHPTDQRGHGFSRINGSNVDMGVFEYGSAFVPNGDFNVDEQFDCADADALVTEIAAGRNPTSFDLNGDSEVNLVDLNLWLEWAAQENGLGSPYLQGDYNLDGFVDVGDFNVWNENKFEATTGWCSGDGNADGVVDVADFNLWNRNQFASSDGSSLSPLAVSAAAPQFQSAFAIDSLPRNDRDRAIDRVFRDFS